MPAKPKRERRTGKRSHVKMRAHGPQSRLVIITGMSGSGKASVQKAFEDLGYYCVDNLPVELIPSLAELLGSSEEPRNAALVVDIREGERLDKLPVIVKEIRQKYHATLMFLEASDEVLLRRYSETRRPHPLGTSTTVQHSLRSERHRLAPIRKMADVVIDTSKFNVHELRAHITELFRPEAPKPSTILVSAVSFGFKHGTPDDADLMFDVRFLPNPHFVPELRRFTGKDPQVAKYIRSFPQTQEFIDRISELLIYLLPHYIEEGKAYLTIAFGCTGGQHRSVMIAEEVSKRLTKAGFRVKVEHRDCPK